MKELNIECTKYINLDNKVWILPSSVAKLKGKGNGNYNNWINSGSTNYLLGNELRLLKDTPLWVETISLFKQKYNMLITTSEDVKLIDIERASAYFSIDKPQQAIYKSLHMNNSYLSLPIQEEPTITSLQFAEQIGLTFKVVHETIRKYKGRLEAFGPLPFETAKVEAAIDGKWTPKQLPDHYKLNENQCYFLATLSKNTPQVVEFKMWLVQTFSELRKERTLSGPINDLLSFLPGNWEGLVQSMLCHLSSYTEHPYRQEVPLKNKGRVDILMSDTEALEIKNHMINPCHIKELIINKAYWFQLKEDFPTFKTLYLTSTKGITQEALILTKLLEPEITYIPLKQLFQRLIGSEEIPLHLFPST